MILRILKSWVFWLGFTVIYLGWPNPDYELDMKDVIIIKDIDLKILGKDLSLTAYPFIFLNKNDNYDEALKHELIHVVQQKREGILFPIKYYYYFSVNYLYYSAHYPQEKRSAILWHSYRNNPYEKEAYKN